MSIITQCPTRDCGATLTVADEFDAGTAHCRDCGTRFRIRPGVGELIESRSQEQKSWEPIEPLPDQTRFAEEAQQASQPESTHDPSVPEHSVFEPERSASDNPADQPGAGTVPMVPAPPEATIPLASSERPAAGGGVGEERADIEAPDADAMAVAEDAVPAVWNEGDVILDLYEVTGVLGEGGFGKVYKVRHRNWNIDLAVKSPKPDKFTSKGQRETFINECETWINLGLHPNIVSCQYVRTLGGIPRVFAEYVDGGSLKDWIDEKKLYRGDRDEVMKRMLDVSIQFAWGLHYAHKHNEGLVHQDVKPANVLVTQNGAAKVGDFGLARARAAAGDKGGAAKSGRSGFVPGAGFMTVEYASPEQAAGMSLTRKTDIWSWGLSVLEMFTGERTWTSGVAAPEILESYLDSDASEGPIPKMPYGVAQLLRQCFRTCETDRPEIQEIAHRLIDVYENETKSGQYWREEPTAAEILADGLNNRALSMLDLGKTAEAEGLYNKALKADVHHPETNYNRGLLLWQSGRMTDDEFVRRMEEVRTSHSGDWKDEYLLGRVHLERGDVEAALPLLEYADRQADRDADVADALVRTRAARSNSSGLVKALLPARRAIIALAGVSGRRFVALGIHETSAKEDSSSGTLQYWDLEEERCIHEFGGFRGHVGTVAVSEDGRIGVTGGRGGDVRLWEMTHGRCLGQLNPRSGNVDAAYGVCLSPDGRRALYGVHQAVRLWDVGNRTLLREYTGVSSTVTACAVSWKENLVLAGTADGKLVSWEIESGRKLPELPSRSEAVTSLAFADRTLLAICGHADGTIMLLSVSSAEIVAALRGHVAQVTGLVATQDGSHAISSSYDHTLRYWELDSGRCLRTLCGHRHFVSDVSLTRDGRYALSGGWDGQVCLWHLCAAAPQLPVLSKPSLLSKLKSTAVLRAKRRDEARKAMTQGNPRRAYECAEEGLGLDGYSHDEGLLEIRHEAALFGRATGLAGAWLHHRIANHVREVTGVAALSSNRRFVSSSRDCTVRVGGVLEGDPERVFEGAANWVTSLAVDPRERFIIAGCGDGKLCQWDLSSGARRDFLGHQDVVTCVAISADGRFAVSGGEDRTIRLWATDTGQCLYTLSGHQGTVTCLAMSSDERLLVSGGEDRTMKLWDLRAGSLLGALDNEGIPETRSPKLITMKGGIQIKSDDTVLTGASSSGPVGDAELMRKVRDYNRRRRELGATEAHGFYVRDGEFLAAAISKDSRYVLGARDDGLLLCWDLETAKCVRKLKGHQSAVSAVCFSPDGRYVLSGSWDSTLRLWAFSSGKCLRVLEGHCDAVTSVCITPDARYAISGSYEGIVCCWELQWEAEFADKQAWEKEAELHLKLFLALHTMPSATLPSDRPPTKEDVRRALTRTGKAIGYEDHFEQLMEGLRLSGYGSLSREIVRREVERMADRWTGPPPLVKPATIFGITESATTAHDETPPPVFCPACGKEAFRHAKFCTECGICLKC